jgi:hypothetical protein
MPLGGGGNRIRRNKRDTHQSAEFVGGLAATGAAIWVNAKELFEAQSPIVLPLKSSCSTIDRFMRNYGYHLRDEQVIPVIYLQRSGRLGDATDIPS